MFELLFQSLDAGFFLQVFVVVWYFFFKVNFFECFSNSITVSNSLDPDHDRGFVGTVQHFRLHEKLKFHAQLS